MQQDLKTKLGKLLQILQKEDFQMTYQPIKVFFFWSSNQSIIEFKINGVLCLMIQETDDNIAFNAHEDNLQVNINEIKNNNMKDTKNTVITKV